MKTFAQLKRDIKEGTIIKTVNNFCKPEMSGQIRKVGKVQSNAIAFTREDGKLSWIWWPKATCIEYDGDTFKVYSEPKEYNNFTKELLFIYQIMKEEPKTRLAKPIQLNLFEC